MTRDAFISQGFDSGSRRVARIDARSNRVAEGYDLDGRPTKRVYPDGTRVMQGWPRSRLIVWPVCSSEAWR